MRLSPINLKILAYTLDVEGFDSAPVLQRCGLGSFDELQEDGEWVPVELFDRMMAAAVDETGDPSFGLVAGKSLALMRYGTITPLALFTPSLRRLLSDLGRFARLAVERSEIEWQEGASTSAQLLVHPVVEGGLSGRFRLEQVATSAMQMLRFCGAESTDILRVEFPHELPAGMDRRYLSTFGPALDFGRKACVIHFNAGLLDRPFVGHDPVAYMAAVTRADSVLKAIESGSDLAELTRQRLLAALPLVPTAAETAASLGMNERSFRRRLGLLGTSHAELVQACQQLTAERLLAEGRMPLKQIAEALGFASVHSFHRAFRRWSGLTPSAWREGAVAGPAAESVS